LARIFKESGEQHGEKHAAVWIDQLSIPQDDEQTRKTLAKILSIYKTLEVAALSRCHLEADVGALMMAKWIIEECS
jgi:hypothetical protein